MVWNKQNKYNHSLYLVSQGAHGQGKEVDINQMVVQICIAICAKYQGREYGAI